MADSIAFGIALLILLGWVTSWSLLGLVVASSLHVSMAFGMMAGALFGPLGVLFVVLAKRELPIPRLTTLRPVSALERIESASIREAPTRDEELYR